MPDPNQHLGTGHSGRGRIPTPEETAAVRTHVGDVLRVLESAEQEGQDFGLAASPRLLEKCREPLARAMDVLGDGPAVAVDLTRTLSARLKPGGALMTGSHLPTLLRSHRALVYGFLGIQWHSRDESAWRRLFARLPFDLEASRFETHPPAALVMLARRNSETNP